MGCCVRFVRGRKLTANRNIAIRQGDTFTHSVVMNYLEGVPEDIGDYTFDSQVRESGRESLSPTPSGDPLASFSVSSAQVSGGKVTVVCTLSHEASSSIPPGRHSYDLQQTSAAGKVTTLIYGSIIVVPEISP